jgi:isoleucyl-tRNA synthetase
MDEKGLRKKALSEIERVTWVPKWGKDRIYGMIENRPDWCISRQRSWGVPITVVYCDSCNTDIINQESLEKVARAMEKEGADVWFDRDVTEFLPEGFACPNCQGTSFTKGEDILDVWFDSGVSYAAVCEKRDGLKPVPDMYLEGSDQHRGWFHSSLLAAVGTRGHAPYREVLTHGFLVDGEGRKMSKSLGNFIAPNEVIEKYGAEILRLWVSAVDYREDIRISQEILQRTSEAYRRIRNTSRFILGNLFDFSPEKDLSPTESLSDLDRHTLSAFAKMKQRVLKAYDDYEFHVIYHAIHNFCAVDLSAQYLDIIKDRLYTTGAASKERRAAQTTMYLILQDIVRLMAPILTFTAEEVWQALPGGDREESVHLTGFPGADETLRDAELEKTWEMLFETRGAVTKVLEEARREKTIGHSLDARVTLAATGARKDILARHAQELSDLFIVSDVVLADDAPKGATESEEVPNLFIMVEKAPGEKCPRCWHYTEDIGKDAAYADVCLRCAGNLKGE